LGNRANFVIVKDQDWQLSYSHWGGCRMLDALIGGPELALRYAASLRRCEKTEWCDPSWADGGAVVDLDRRRVLFFGEPLMVTMNERRALMDVLGTVASIQAKRVYSVELDWSGPLPDGSCTCRHHADGNFCKPSGPRCSKSLSAASDRSLERPLASKRFAMTPPRESDLHYLSCSQGGDHGSAS
jgi:hypothetical protein